MAAEVIPNVTDPSESAIIVVKVTQVIQLRFEPLEHPDDKLYLVPVALLDAEELQVALDNPARRGHAVVTTIKAGRHEATFDEPVNS